jgi:transposase
MDNLTAHHHPAVIQLILGRGHNVVFRAPYYPVDGPIEYVFNTLQCTLSHRMFEIDNYQDLNNHLRAIIRNIDDFVPYFENVGFTN